MKLEKYTSTVLSYFLELCSLAYMNVYMKLRNYFKVNLSSEVNRVLCQHQVSQSEAVVVVLS